MEKEKEEKVDVHTNKEKKSRDRAQDEEINELKNTLKRIQAEFENYQKRNERETEEFKKIANAGLIEDLLPVLDTLEHGIIHNKEFASVKEQMESILRKKGLERIEVKKGDDFDHEKMECLMNEEDPKVEEGKVAKVLVNGYMLEGRILRPAKISINKLKGSESSAKR